MIIRQRCEGSEAQRPGSLISCTSCPQTLTFPEYISCELYRGSLPFRNASCALTFRNSLSSLSHFVFSEKVCVLDFLHKLNILLSFLSYLSWLHLVNVPSAISPCNDAWRRCNGIRRSRTHRDPRGPTAAGDHSAGSGEQRLLYSFFQLCFTALRKSRNCFMFRYLVPFHSKNIIYNLITCYFKIIIAINIIQGAHRRACCWRQSDRHLHSSGHFLYVSRYLN